MSAAQSIVLLGATGSIGTSCLDVIRRHSTQLRAAGLTAFRSREKLVRQIDEFQPDWAVLGCRATVSEGSEPQTAGQTWADRGRTRCLDDLDAVPALIRRPEIDTVLSAIVGSAGLAATWAAVDSGKRVAIANKETLVMAGPMIMARAAETGALLLPVDSEHSAVFQCLASGKKEELRRIVLTASGGPFRGWTSGQMKQVTPEMALKHPTWKMGPKISVDSATMMNKALEIIEARWLFGISADQIGVVIHPQSVIHSFVEYRDGSVISQMSPPDMRLAIQYALTFPERLENSGKATDWSVEQTLELIPPDLEAFPALRLGFEVAKSGGTSGAVLNAANEEAVDRFLRGELRFDQIVQVSDDVLRHHQYEARPSIEQLMALDEWARKEANRWKN